MKLKIALSAALLKQAQANSGLVPSNNPSEPIKLCPDGMPCGRHIAATRDMIFDLAEMSDSPLGLFSHKPAPGKVVPRDMIRNHGCYCFYQGCSGEQECRSVTRGISPRVPEFSGMEYKTKLDKLCHNVHKAHTCLQQEMSSCTNMRQHYKWNIIDGKIICEHKKNDACQVALCKIDREFAERMVSWARADADEVRSWYGPFTYKTIEEYQAECPNKQRSKPQPLDSEGKCCGLGLDRAFYKRIPVTSECCVEKDNNGNVYAETVRPIGMCM